jgi:CHAT domain-containing protein
VLLAYFLGRKWSYLLLLDAHSAEVFPLTVGRSVARWLRPRRSVELRLEGSEAWCWCPPRPPARPPLPPRQQAESRVPLGQDLARALIDQYLWQIESPGFTPRRGMRLEPPRGRPAPPAQRLELLADVLLPEAARRSLRARTPRLLLIVPDGALHKLPLEALVVESGERPRYLLDILPATVYAPSVTALALLANRPRPSGPPTLLTLCDPAYVEAKGPETAPASRSGLLVLRGHLTRLPFTADESRLVRGCYEPGQVLALEGKGASERALRRAVAGRRVVHLAAHGFADDRLGNLFGAVALTPPAPGEEAPENDGFLSLHEIYQLPLSDCELVVLSACQTNTGPQRPLEAGVTLASGFLAAGARKVLASHWSVDDRSTAELMSHFFREAQDGVSHPEALYAARRAVRSQPGWGSPYHWAPFVLLGPPH